jgi:3-oxoacyl-[acyl-carrier-protein] synthase-3
MNFDFGTDGSGYNAIIIPHGGSRNKINENSLIVKDFEPGISRSENQLLLNGMDVFLFGISQAPKTVKNLFEKFNFDQNNVDFFVFHQANLKMNKTIAKLLKIPLEKVLFSLKKFGNTSSASIPLTMVLELKNKEIQSDLNLILCGFGVGLSWGTVYLSIKKDISLIFSEYE